MNNANFPEIRSKRLLLRQLQPTDWETISFLRSDKKVNEFVIRPGAKSKKEALAFISKINKGIIDKTLYYWVITEKTNPKMIGSICLWNFSEDKKVAEVGYDLHPEHQGKGVMTESLKSVVRFGFNTLHLEHIEAFTHQLNESSTRLLEKNGFSLVPDKKDEHNLNNIVYDIKKSP